MTWLDGCTPYHEQAHTHTHTDHKLHGTCAGNWPHHTSSGVASSFSSCLAKTARSFAAVLSFTKPATSPACTESSQLWTWLSAHHPYSSHSDSCYRCFCCCCGVGLYTVLNPRSFTSICLQVQLLFFSLQMPLQVMHLIFCTTQKMIICPPFVLVCNH